jgi:DNA invertase Pin-like site-specific DNA recombinase/ArsR family metal-binding transcriptional regulator
MIGIYCRTSKARKEKYTIEVQKEKGIKFAKSLGLPYKIYIDDGISGTKDESSRDGISEMFEDMRNQVISATYSVEQARIERDTPTWHLFVSLSLNFKIKYFDGGREVDLENPTNRMLAELMSVVNSFYAQLTSQKVKEANAKKVKEGKTHGLKPYGYARDQNNKYVIVEEEAKHVRRIFDLSLSGLGAYTIANILNSEGVPTKFKRNFDGVIKRKDPDTRKIKEHKKEKIIWRGNVISDMLRNPIYKGTRIWKMYEIIPEYENGRTKKRKRLIDQIVTTEHVPPIIDEATWEKVSINLSRNKKNVGPKDKYRYLLNGLLVCGICGEEIRGKNRPKGNDSSYKCTNKRYPNAKCNNRGLNIYRLDTFIIKLLSSESQIKQIISSLPDRASNSTKLNNLLTIKQNEEANISKRIKSLILMASKVEESEEIEELADQLKLLKNKKNNLTLEIQEIESKINEELKGRFEERNSVGKRELKKISGKLELPENFPVLKNVISNQIDFIKITYDPNLKHYLLEIQLAGKSKPLFFGSDRISEKWQYYINSEKKMIYPSEDQPFFVVDFYRKNNFKLPKAGIFSSFSFRIRKEDYIKII